MYPIFASSLDLATVDVSPTADFDPRLAWQEEDLLMNSFGAFLKRKFGGRTQRVSIDAGFTCPNVDGAVARGGCNFCDNRSFSPSRRVRLSTRTADESRTLARRDCPRGRSRMEIVRISRSGNSLM